MADTGDPQADAPRPDDPVGERRPGAHLRESDGASPADDAVDLDAAAQEFEVDLEALLAEREQFLDAYRRVAADFENFRKQSQKRLEDEVIRISGTIVERLLPVLDAVDAARAHGSDDVEAIGSQLLLALEKDGLVRVHPEGEPFDPNLAEAVLHEAGDGEATVVEVLRTGYLWKGRVLRPAMVKVQG